MTLLEVDSLKVHFPVRRGLLGRAAGTVKAVDGVSLAVAPGETLGLVGESGCGKSTSARAILRLVPITAGRVRLDGADVAALEGAALRRARRKMQMIFQDPYASLDPRMTVLELVGEPLVTHERLGAAALRERVAGLLDKVGLPRAALGRYPHEFSGGQRQRIGIARALALGPKLVVADEPVSALDMSIRSQIVNLLEDLQRELGIAYLFIAHDLAIVRHIARRMAVMYLGRIVEEGPAERVFAAPAHPYTQALLAAAPTPDPRVERKRRHLALAGEPPSPLDPPDGCAFHPRCPHVMDRCKSERPELGDRGEGQRAACWLEAAP